jgi:hypothetical protein
MTAQPRFSANHLLVSRRHELILAGLGVGFLAAHLPFLAEAPGTVDGANFLLGVQDFDLADHRPHPPGYPVFIALGKLSTALVNLTGVQDPTRYSAQALAVWGTLFGALASFVLFAYFRGLSGDRRQAVGAAALSVTCPLFWFNAARPMSDVTGLVASLAAQAVLLASRRDDASLDRQRLILGAAMAGIAVGFRLQNALLTLPLLVWLVTRGGVRPLHAGWAVTAMTIGLLLWAAPLVWASGGLTPYLTELRKLGLQDFSGNYMLATNATATDVIQALLYTFAYPWANTALAVAVFALSAIGGAAVLTRSRGTATLLALSVLPYGLFHLAFQETIHTRYALPLTPAIAYLAVVGLHTVSQRVMPWTIVALSIVGVVITTPAVIAYSTVPSPVRQAVADIRLASSGRTDPLVLAAHGGVDRVIRGHSLPMKRLSSLPRHEWLALVDHWRRAPHTPVWFLADVNREDLVLIDPASRRLVRSYDWSFRRKFLMTRVPADRLDWYEIAPPGWMADEGWSLSLETSGVAQNDDLRTGVRPAVVFVRQRSGATVLMIGGRNVSGPAGPSVRIDLSIGDALFDSWTVAPDPEMFFKMWQLPAGTLSAEEPYLRLEVRATPIGANATPFEVVYEQFDLQPVDSVVWGLDTDWYPEEYQEDIAVPWRWSGPTGTLRVHHAGRDVILRIRGEVPLAHLGGPPRLSVRTGDRLITQTIVHDTAMDLQVRVPADALTESGGRLTVETDRSFVPDDVLHNGDGRRLGVRAFQIELEEVQTR